MNCDVQWATVTGTRDDGQEKVIIALSGILWMSVQVGTVGMSLLLLTIETSG